MKQYEAQLQELNETVDHELLEQITNGLGPANYNDDASYVSATDSEEVKRVYTNFVADELEVDDEEKGMKAIASVLEKNERNEQKTSSRSILSFEQTLCLID